MWGARICKRTSSSRFDLVRTRLTEACSFVSYDSAHTTYLETICVDTLGCLSNLSCAQAIVPVTSVMAPFNKHVNKIMSKNQPDT